MKQNKTTREKFNQLHRQAEKLMKANGVITSSVDVENPIKLIHELQTSQIELELQNEELHRSEQELMRSKIKYIELYDFAPVAYVTLNLIGVILNANLTFADILLMERSLLINQPMSTLIYFEDQDIYYHHLRELSELKERQICELRLTKKDGTPLDVQMESTITFDGHGGIEQYRSVVIDISDRKQAEKDREMLQVHLRQAHKMKSIRTLIGGIAHDFNNILYMIIGNAELALEDIPKWDPAHTNIERIKTAGLKAADIVKLLLNFSQKTEQKHKILSVVTVVKDTLKILRSSIPASIEIRKHFPNEDVAILMDPVQISQVLINLCTNAFQEMEASGGIIEIKVETKFLTQEAAVHYPGLGPGDYVRIMVKDTGPGIDPEIIERIFDPYFTTREIGKGSGMGLSVVFGIVKDHNGSIVAVSEPGKGTRFTLLFPMMDINPVKHIETMEELPWGRETILFVDDEPAIIEMSQKMLGRLGYHVETELDPEEALALFKLRPDFFDVVVTDMTMPKMNGVKFAKYLMEIRPDIPVIIYTGNNPLIDEKKARQHGIAAYIMKPLSMSKLAKLIRKVLDEQEKI